MITNIYNKVVARVFYLLLVPSLLLCSCDDMFTPADENKRQAEDMTEESTYAHGLLIFAYERLPYVTTTQTDIATDDAVTNVTTNNYLTMATGSWASDNNPMTQWDNCKQAIQYANLFLSIVDKVKWAPSAVSKQQMFIDRMKGEAFGLRAVFYYFLLQAHGGYADDGQLYGVPLLTVAEDGGSDFNQPRATFADCVKQIYADCDSAMALLPDFYEDISTEEDIPAKYRALGANASGYNLVFGQKSKNLMSGKAAQAIKAQVALLAASPAFRDQSGVTSAEAATFSANVLKSIGGVAGMDNLGSTWYKNKARIDNSTTTEIPEILWRQDRGNAGNEQESDNFPPTLYGRGMVNPSQNLVDAFPMVNGRPITDPQSGYDSQNPYANRDPRLAEDIIYHGSTFKKAVILTGVGMPNEKNEETDNLNNIGTSTRTGYYLKKLLREDVATASSGSAISQYHIFPRIRYTELFLAYAEAANDAWGPNADPTGVGFTAYDVIKAIRERGGLGHVKDETGTDIPDVYLEECKSDKEKMTQLIRNERRIELCFENKRFWDLRRWQMPLNESVKGMKIEKVDPEREDSPLKYTVIDVEDRKYDSSYQWYGPIPKEEVLKWNNLKQNKGWQ